MIKVISIASILLFSSVAVAGLNSSKSVVTGNTTVNGDLYESKMAALENGKMQIMDINSLSSVELSKTVRWGANEQVDINSFELLNSQVQVNEVVTNKGAIAYQPVMNVSYEYTARKRD
ncbi:DUF3316 domain-containing protein [uncultured Vibrio sp.]|uniref:DUF3316 domain-containing protein n=1 Tax=uncultured Vibrio sp. TaxID=114054 RepID=UPI0025CDE3C4|nr:DUF3316 domain-containing protein [uncultured Vibrio sp.]